MVLLELLLYRAVHKSGCRKGFPYLAYFHRTCGLNYDKQNRKSCRCLDFSALKKWILSTIIKGRDNTSWEFVMQGIAFGFDLIIFQFPLEIKKKKEKKEMKQFLFLVFCS